MPVPRISREELKARLDSPDSSSHPLIVDVRLKYPYEHSTVTLPAAQRIPPDAMSSASLPRDRDIVLFDSDPHDMVSTEAGATLMRRGYRVLVLQGGIAEWMNAKLPVDTKSAPQPAAPAAKAPPPGAAARPAAPGVPAKAAAPAAASAVKPSAPPPAPAAQVGGPHSDATSPPAQASPTPDKPRPAESSAAAAAPKSAAPAAVEGPATPATESES